MAKDSALGDQEIRELLLPYGVEVSTKLCAQIQIYIETLLFWNKKISLTTITDPHEIVRFHFGESFFAGSLSHMEEGRVADIGTGAGFPGIPMRMVNSGVQLTLVEPTGKKTAFLAEISRKLDIQNVDIIRCRMVDLPTDVAPFDLIVSRALGDYAQLLKDSIIHLSPHGRVLFLLGMRDAQEICRNDSWVWENPVIIPRSDARFVLSGFPKVA